MFPKPARLTASPAPGEAPEPAAKAASAPDKKKDPARPELAKHQIYGQLRAVRGTDFWTLNYVKVEDRRARKVSAFVKIPEKAKLYMDRLLRITDLEEGAKVQVLGKPVEREAVSASGFIDIDRQMTNVAALLTGELMTVDASYRDRRDPEIRWLQGEITQGAPAVYVGYKGAEYKLVMLRGSPIIKREKKELESGEKTPLKSGMYVGLYLDKADERPETGRSSDDEKESYEARAVVIADPRLVRSTYPLLFPQGPAQEDDKADAR